MFFIGVVIFILYTLIIVPDVITNLTDVRYIKSEPFFNRVMIVLLNVLLLVLDGIIGYITFLLY